MEQVGIYARLSRDRDGAQTATKRQVADARALACARGWSVAQVYEDVDLSAYKRVPRPEYERMLGDLRDGAITHVVVWKLDRLVRHPAEFERFWEVCEKAGGKLVSVNEPIDTSNELGLVIVRILIAFARLESATIATRIRSKQREIAAEGRHHGGGRRAYGLSADWRAIVPEEAAFIRDAAQRLLAGESLRGVVRDLTEKGMRASNGKPWRAANFRHMLTKERLSGSVDGVHGGIPAILDEDTHRRLILLLSDKRRLLHSGSARTHLLSGLLRCGLCGGPMYAHRAPNGKRYNYACAKHAGGCGRVVIHGPNAEEQVEEMVLVAAESPEFSSAVERRRKRTGVVVDFDQLREDEAALMALDRARYVERTLSQERYDVLVRELQARIEDTKAKIMRRESESVVVALGNEARAKWAASGLEWRRTFITAMAERIEVTPATLRGRYDPERIQVRYRY